jgi:hypothetical protein
MKAGQPVLFGSEASAGAPEVRPETRKEPMREGTLHMRGEHAHTLPRPNRLYSTGRVCAEDGCDTILSRYNRSKLCWQHEPLRYDVLRGRKKKRPDDLKAA